MACLSNPWISGPFTVSNFVYGNYKKKNQLVMCFKNILFRLMLYFNFTQCYSQKSYVLSVDDSFLNFGVNFAVACTNSQYTWRISVSPSTLSLLNEHYGVINEFQIEHVIAVARFLARFSAVVCRWWWDVCFECRRCLKNPLKVLAYPPYDSPARPGKTVKRNNYVQPGHINLWTHVEKFMNDCSFKQTLQGKFESLRVLW